MNVSGRISLLLALSVITIALNISYAASKVRTTTQVKVFILGGFLVTGSIPVWYTAVAKVDETSEILVDRYLFSRSL
jgi:hypothetical protein